MLLIHTLLALAPLLSAAPAPRPSGGDAFISALREVLQEDHADVRDPVWILRTSGFKPENVVVELSKLLPGLDAHAAVEAEYMLGRLGPAAAAATPALTERLLASEDLDVRHGAAVALGRIGPGAKSAVKALMMSSADPSLELRAACAAALRRVAPRP